MQSEHDSADGGRIIRLLKEVLGRLAAIERALSVRHHAVNHEQPTVPVAYPSQPIVIPQPPREIR